MMSKKPTLSGTSRLLPRGGALALLTCFPFVPHHPAIIEYGVPTMCAPLGFSAISVAAVLAATFATREWAPTTRCRFSRLMPIAIALLLGCDIVYALWRLGSPMPFPKHVVESVDVISQTLFLASCALSTEHGPIDNERSPDSDQANRATTSVALISAALIPRLFGFLDFVLQDQIYLQAGVCFLSGLIGYRLFAALEKTTPSPNNRFTAKVAALLGLLFSSVFDELTLAALCSVRLNINSQDAATLENVARGYVAGLGAYCMVIALIGLLLLLCSGTRGDCGETLPQTSPRSIPGLELLSPRQQQVLLMALGGLSDTQISQELGLAPGTVGNHKRRGLERLGISEIGELASSAESTDESIGSAEPATRPFTEGLILLIGTAAPCAATTIRMDPDTAYYLSMALGLALASASSIPLILRSQALAAKASTSAKQPDSFAFILWFTLAGAITLCWSFANRTTTLAIGIALFCAMLGKRLAPSDPHHSETEARCPRAQTPTAYPRGVSGTLAAALAFSATGIILASHVSRALGIQPAEASRCHLAAQLILGFASISIIKSYILAKSSSDEAPDKEDTGSNQGAFFRSKGLSPLESQVATLSMKGYTRPQICEKLHIAAGTVNSCRASAYKKLEVHNINELILLCGETPGKTCR